jgi:hypothetical protein
MIWCALTNRLRRHGLKLLAAVLIAIRPSLKTSQQSVVGAQTEPATAQQNTDNKPAASTEPVDRALDIIAYAASLISHIPRLEGRVGAYAALGDTLWQFDRARAREYFRSAFITLAKVDVSTKPKDRQAARAQEQLKRWKSQTRKQLLSSVAQLDVDLAKEFARRFGEKEDQGSSDDEPALASESVELVFQRAYELLNTDPEQAAALVEQTLAAGVSPWLIEFLSALRERAPALADHLFQVALNVILAQSHPPDVSLLHLLGPYLLEANGSGDPGLARRFLTWMANGLQAQSDGIASGVRRASAAEQRYLAQLYLPLFEQYTPELVPMVQSLLSQLNANVPPQQGPQGSGSAPNGQGGLGSGIGSGSSSGEPPPISKSGVGGVGDLMSPKPEPSGDSSAEGFIMKLPDQKLRQALLDARRYNTARQMVEQGKIDEACQTAQQIKDVLKQIDLFVELGKSLADKGEPERAISLFDRSYQLISSVNDLHQGAFQAFVLARRVLPVDRDRAFHYAQGAIALLNRWQSHEPTDADPMRERTRRQALRGQLESIFLPLGRAQFEQALYLAVQLQDPEQRVLAQIAACRPVLEKAEKRKPQN